MTGPRRPEALSEPDTGDLRAGKDEAPQARIPAVRLRSLGRVVTVSVSGRTLR